MSRHAPLVTKKEIIYRRSFIDDHNDRFDEIMRNPGSYPPRRAEPERPQHLVVSHNYQSDVAAEYQLSKINKKLDRIIEILRNPAPKKTVEEQVNVDNVRQEQTRQYKDICNRLEKLETDLTGKHFPLAPLHDEIVALTAKVQELAKIQEDLHAKLDASNISGEDIDELLKVINETRLDMEEKIGNIKQLSDGNYIHLEDKLDGYLRNQHGIQLQVDHLMNLLTQTSRPVSVVESRPVSRPSSAAEKLSLSRSSSSLKYVSLKPSLVVPTSRSPPPIVQKSPSEVSYASTNPKTERSASHKSNTTITSSNTIASIHSLKRNTQAVPPQVAPLKPVRSPTYEILEKTKSIETMNEIYNKAQKESAASIVSSSSGSFIPPLVIDERRNSQPANIFLTRKQ